MSNLTFNSHHLFIAMSLDNWLI